MTMSVSRARSSFSQLKKIKNKKKHTGNKKQSKKHWKKSENLIIKQKYVKTYPRDK